MSHLHILPLIPQRSGADSVPSADPLFPVASANEEHHTDTYGEYFIILNSCYRRERKAHDDEPARRAARCIITITRRPPARRFPRRDRAKSAPAATFVSLQIGPVCLDR
jgi:hypothetical protein